MTEQDIADRFVERYGEAQGDVTRKIELSVIGGDWGANGYTTRAQADSLAMALELRASDTLLDLGAGRGWPGLYLAATTGCEVVLTDPPRQALRLAMDRAAQEGLAGRAAAVAASGRALPLMSGKFDAVVHTDVLCCLRQKAAVLRECRRMLRMGGRMAFLTIHPAVGLTRAQRRRAHRNGPIAVATPRPHRQMLETAGFIDVSETDCTGEFARVARAWINECEAHAAELESLLGAKSVEERQSDRRAQLRAVENGLLCRSLFIARAGPRRRTVYRRNRSAGDQRSQW